MKSRFSLFLVGILCLRLVGHAADLSVIPFEVVRPQFEAGDSIVIQEVRATSPQLKIGDTVVVRGQYRLQSKPKAKVGLHLTSRGPSGPTRVLPEQQVEIAAGSGSFELKHVVAKAGDLHVSFYPVPSGSSFGGVYFSASN